MRDTSISYHPDNYRDTIGRIDWTQLVLALVKIWMVSLLIYALLDLRARFATITNEYNPMCEPAHQHVTSLPREEHARPENRVYNSETRVDRCDEAELTFRKCECLGDIGSQRTQPASHYGNPDHATGVGQRLTDLLTNRSNLIMSALADLGPPVPMVPTRRS